MNTTNIPKELDKMYRVYAYTLGRELTEDEKYLIDQAFHHGLIYGGF